MLSDNAPMKKEYLSEVQDLKVIKDFTQNCNDGSTAFTLKAGTTVRGRIIKQTTMNGRESWTSVELSSINLPSGCDKRDPGYMGGARNFNLVPLSYFDASEPVNWYLYGGLALAAAVGIYFIMKK